MIEETFEAVKYQMGPCGIACGLCDLGNGTVAETAKKTADYLRNYGVSQWAPLVPGGSEIDFDLLFGSLDWVSTSVGCFGCEKGGGPPDCAIRICAKEKEHDICSGCPDLEGCGKFDWLGEYGGTLRGKLKGSKGKSKRELIEEAITSIE
ncbi:MAG: DUF3795 domain-containing protein [Candidatus Bathyarchaeia archaeon]